MGCTSEDPSEHLLQIKSHTQRSAEHFVYALWFKPDRIAVRFPRQLSKPGLTGFLSSGLLSRRHGFFYGYRVRRLRSQGRFCASRGLCCRSSRPSLRRRRCIIAMSCGAEHKRDPARRFSDRFCGCNQCVFDLCGRRCVFPWHRTRIISFQWQCRSSGGCRRNTPEQVRGHVQQRRENDCK